MSLIIANLKNEKQCGEKGSMIWQIFSHSLKSERSNCIHVYRADVYITPFPRVMERETNEA